MIVAPFFNNMEQPTFKQAFEMELARLGIYKASLLGLLDISRPTLDKRLKDPSSFRIYEVKKLQSLGIKLDFFNANKFKW